MVAPTTDSTGNVVAFNSRYHRNHPGIEAKVLNLGLRGRAEIPELRPNHLLGRHSNLVEKSRFAAEGVTVHPHGGRSTMGGQSGVLYVRRSMVAAVLLSFAYCPACPTPW
jgi:hypothetical protein